MRAPIESLKKVFAAVVYTGTQHGGSAPSPHTCDPRYATDDYSGQCKRARLLATFLKLAQTPGSYGLRAAATMHEELCLPVITTRVRLRARAL